MPYIHVGCGGVVPLRFPVRCRKCKHKWPWTVMFAPTPPKDMRFVITPPVPARGTTQYAKWADRIPGAGLVASKLPKWPRWARILTVSGIIAGVAFLIGHFVG